MIKIEVREMMSFENSTSPAVSSSPSAAAETSFLISPSPDERSRKKEKCGAEYGLVDYDSLPDFLKHNEFILNYYRSEWPIKQTILSVFSVHNETLNVWTHLIGFVVFLALTAFAVTMHPTDGTAPSVDHNHHLPTAINISHGAAIPLHQTNQTGAVFTAADDLDQALREFSIGRWPFYAYLCGAMFCLLSSSLCHLLCCHSEHTCYVVLRLDYAGISALIVTSFYPLVYYSFACDPFVRDLYLGFITVFGLATVLVSLVPAFESPDFRVLRAGLFAGMAVSGLVPIVHKAIAFGNRPEAAVTTAYEVAMMAMYGAGVVVYAARIPERWMPGRFDLAGNSHQLFHVLVIAGAYTHYLAGLVYLQWRESEGCS